MCINKPHPEISITLNIMRTSYFKMGISKDYVKIGFKSNDNVNKSRQCPPFLCSSLRFPSGKVC